MVTTKDAAQVRAQAGYARRFAEVTVFVGVWMALGYLLPNDPNLYLLVGVPLTVAFQLVVRRRPLRELWVRSGPRFRLDRKGVILAAALAILPAILLVQALGARQWIPAAWLVACLAGAVAAAYALRRLRRDEVGNTLRWTAIPAITGVVVLGALIVPAVIASPQAPQPLSMIVAGLQSALLYLSVTFVLEEVSFRGALDAHVHQPGDPRAWLSAVFLSALWGLWHLPIADMSQGIAITVAQLLLVHTIVGVPLSFAWRRTGLLVAPALAHALIDGVRNALIAGL